MAKKRRSNRTGPVVVKRNGKTFIRKRPKSHRIYVDPARKVLSQKDKTRAQRLKRQQVLLSLTKDINKSYTQSKVSHHVTNNNPEAAFRTATAHAGLNYAIDNKTYDNSQELRQLQLKGMQKQVNKHQDFKGAKVKDSFWSGAHVNRGSRKYLVKEKNVFNKRKWNK